MACIGSLWPIYDAPAADFAVSFYRRVLEGHMIGEAMRQARLGAGINRNAEAAIVQFAPAKDSFMPQTVMLIPVSDPAAFVKGFGQSRKEGDIDVVRLPRVPLPGYIAAWGTYAAVAMDPQLLSRKPGGFKPDARTGKLLADKANDIVIYANVKVMRERVLPWIKAHTHTALLNWNVFITFSRRHKNSGFLRIRSVRIENGSEKVRPPRPVSYEKITSVQ